MHVMKHLLKTNCWSCALVSFAMAYDMEVEDLIKLVGHDGSEIIFPDLEEPLCRRGHHIQELVLAGFEGGLCVTPLEFAPVTGRLDRRYVIPDQIRKGTTRSHWFELAIHNNRGVMTGFSTRSRCHHANAFERGTVFDPDGPSYEYTLDALERHTFIPQCLWIVEHAEV